MGGPGGSLRVSSLQAGVAAARAARSLPLGAVWLENIGLRGFRVHLQLCLFLRSLKVTLCSHHLDRRISGTVPGAVVCDGDVKGDKERLGHVSARVNHERFIEVNF